MSSVCLSVCNAVHCGYSRQRFVRSTIGYHSKAELLSSCYFCLQRACSNSKLARTQAVMHPLDLITGLRLWPEAYSYYRGREDFFQARVLGP